MLDDGSKDNTVAILESYKPRISVLQQKNRGVAAARNALCSLATGDLIAFLDHDDAWHPDYLKTQSRLFAEHPEGAAFFTDHETFYGAEDFPQWKPMDEQKVLRLVLFSHIEFIRRYHQAMGPFMSMSFCCVPKTALQRLGQPFCEKVTGADDTFIFHRLPFFGPVVYYPGKLAGYRIAISAQSASRIIGNGRLVGAMERLGQYYNALQDAQLRATYRWALAGDYRKYGKVLMCGGRAAEARRQFFRSLTVSNNPASVVRSLGLLVVTFLPRPLQPRWPATNTFEASKEELGAGGPAPTVLAGYIISR